MNNITSTKASNEDHTKLRAALGGDTAAKKSLARQGHHLYRLRIGGTDELMWAESADTALATAVAEMMSVDEGGRTVTEYIDVAVADALVPESDPLATDSVRVDPVGPACTAPGGHEWRRQSPDGSPTVNEACTHCGAHRIEEANGRLEFLRYTDADGNGIAGDI